MGLGRTVYNFRALGVEGGRGGPTPVACGEWDGEWANVGYSTRWIHCFCPQWLVVIIEWLSLVVKQDFQTSNIPARKGSCRDPDLCVGFRLTVLNRRLGLERTSLYR